MTDSSPFAVIESVKLRPMKSSAVKIDILVSGLLYGMILADLVKHAGQFSIVGWQLMNPFHCPYCGYMYSHPIVKHDNYRGECGWR